MSERILLKFCKPLDAPDYPGGTVRTNLDNSLSFLLKTTPGFIDMVRGHGARLAETIPAIALEPFCIHSKSSPDNRVAYIGAVRCRLLMQFV
jgi:hypothetical protein